MTQRFEPFELFQSLKRLKRLMVFRKFVALFCLYLNGLRLLGKVAVSAQR